MRVAVFADVHGNAQALEAVLDDIARHGPDHVVFGGDLAFGGPQPQVCVDRVRAMGIPAVRGNTDEWFGDRGGPGDPISTWTRRRLSAEARRWLGALPVEYRLDDLVVVHATPWSTSDLVPAHADPVLQQRMLDAAGARAVVYGHIHIAWIGHPPGGGLLVNTGSVGFPFDGDPRASYALLERGAEGWTATTRRVAYDVEAAARAFPPDHPDPHTWAARMRTGRR